MEILPGIGVGELNFGMTKSQVFERLGFPDKSYLTESEAREVQYFALRLALTFEPNNDDRLGWIEVHDKQSTVFGVSPWGMPQPQVLDLFTKSLGERPEKEDYRSFESFTYPESWVELQFEFGSLSCINIGVRYDDSESPMWPVKA
ncbi:hypothetical protein [Lysobacter niastensis]|uniref:Uncharacterized protein n=1 Tax=Lysobacter niastensis TaxID=380629 RepID=A0ABS0B3E5_9GAMM|nr:hypothetical protein [Lysobacter niastensis]MBF6023002.1 hypothetical protein [Lysobacter niastensis]